MVDHTENKLAAAFQKRVERVEYICTAESILPNLAVHEIRRIFKRMRALLKFYFNSSDPFFSECKQQLIKNGKSLSLLRESDVNIQVFDKVTSVKNLIPDRKMKAAKEKLVENNRLLIAKLFFENNSCSTIHEFMKLIKSRMLVLCNAEPTEWQLLEQLSSSFSKGYAFYQNLTVDPDPEELHSLRKKLKVLYYQMEFLEFIPLKYFKTKSDQVYKITELLGQDHDLCIFLNDIKQSECDFNSQEFEIFENQIQHLRELNGLNLNTRLKQFFSDSPEKFNQKMEEIFRHSNKYQNQAIQ